MHQTLQGARRQTEDERSRHLPPQVDFLTCPRCNGYGIPDRGGRCRACEGSGELIVDRETRRTIRKLEFLKMVDARDSAAPTRERP